MATRVQNSPLKLTMPDDSGSTLADYRNTNPDKNVFSRV